MNAKQGQRLGIILVLAGFAIGIPGFWLVIAHDHFEATARVRVLSVGGDSDGRTDHFPTNYANYYQNEFEIIKSEYVLSRVNNTLHLDAEWGNKYAEGRKLELAETLGLLKQSLHLHPVRNTMQIDISVISEDPVEAAKIVNAVVEAYQDCHVMMRKDIDGLSSYLKYMEERIVYFQRDVDQWKTGLNVPEGVPDERLVPKYRPYLKAKQELNEQVQARDDFKAKTLSNIRELQLSQGILEQHSTLSVSIVDFATPPTLPIGPNRTLGKGLIGVGVLLLVCGFVTFVRNWRRPDESAA